MTKSDVIAFDTLYESMLKCKRGVSWKSSVAHLILNAIPEIEKLSEQLQNGTYKEKPHKSFKVYRPKQRDIVSIHFRDRIYQRSLNDNVVMPECSKHLIYDNCACQKGKGTDFARNRLKTHLHRYYRKYGSNGYVLQIDIKGYYPNMEHTEAKAVFAKYLDAEIYNMVCVVLDSYEGEKGFNPGSQLVQIAGIIMLNELDHLIKEQYGIKFFVKYSDDFILVDSNEQKLQEIKVQIERFLQSKGFELNLKKTKLYPISRGIPFLGFRFHLTETGKVLAFVLPEKIKDDRRNIRKLAMLVVEHKMTEKEYYNSYRCRRASYSYGDSKKLLFKMDKFVKGELQNAKRKQSPILDEKKYGDACG